MDVNEAIRKEAAIRRYSERTIETYQNCVNRFFQYCGKEAREVTKKDIREFLENLSEKSAGATIHVYLNAIKFFFEDVLRRNMRIDIRYSRRPKKLPQVLSKEEVKRLIYSIQNHKHKLMISMMYSAGLRVSELINLKAKDLNFKEKYGYVRGGKGNKDRIFIISEKIERALMSICLGKNKDDYVFITNRNDKYNVASLQQIIKKAARNARIDKRVSCHTLRHSFATHLIENGYSLNEVQALLGHKSPETSMIYVHIASPKMINAKSPLDSL